MSAEIASCVVALFVCSTAAFIAWLRFRQGEQSATVVALSRQLERLENEVRSTRAVGISPAQMTPHRMGMR